MIRIKIYKYTSKVMMCHERKKERERERKREKERDRKRERVDSGLAKLKGKEIRIFVVAALILGPDILL